MFGAKYLVVFTGAGISTESGLPDFRGPDRIWTRQAKGLPAEVRLFDSAEPNSGHTAIVELQNLGKLNFLISQNVDNLHLKSGIRADLLAELHGNITKLRCTRCEAELVIINQGETPFDRIAHLRFWERIGEVLPEAVIRLKQLMEAP